ncbi:MAG: hypothetical protein QXK94_03505 [Candidatus Jordarchaeales archaeon]
MFNQTAIMAPIFFAAFIVYMRVKEHVERRCRTLGTTGALFFAVAVISFNSALWRARAGFNLSLFFIFYFAQSAPP